MRANERRLLTEDMKLEAVVVTVVWVEEEEYLSALARKVHITALQVNRSPPHSSLRGMWSWTTQTQARTDSSRQLETNDTLKDGGVAVRLKQQSGSVCPFWATLETWRRD